MNALLFSMMITWTDIFEGIGELSYWVFDCMKAMGNGPNWLIGGFVIFLLFFWTWRLTRYKKIAQREGTFE